MTVRHRPMPGSAVAGSSGPFIGGATGPRSGVVATASATATMSPASVAPITILPERCMSVAAKPAEALPAFSLDSRVLRGFQCLRASLSGKGGGQVGKLL